MKSAMFSRRLRLEDKNNIVTLNCRHKFPRVTVNLNDLFISGGGDLMKDHKISYMLQELHACVLPFCHRRNRKVVPQTVYGLKYTI